MTCLIYEEIKSQIKKLIDEVNRNMDAEEGDDKAWNYWKEKADHLYTALIEIERAQYQKKPGMK